MRWSHSPFRENQTTLAPSPPLPAHGNSLYQRCVVCVCMCVASRLVSNGACVWSSYTTTVGFLLWEDCLECFFFIWPTFLLPPLLTGGVGTGGSCATSPCGTPGDKEVLQWSLPPAGRHGRLPSWWPHVYAQNTNLLPSRWHIWAGKHKQETVRVWASSIQTHFYSWHTPIEQLYKLSTGFWQLCTMRLFT